MTISIVTLSFNQARFLPDCLDSVLSQEDVRSEHIVVDPGSEDGSREIVRQRIENIADAIFEADAGPADGLNKGFARSTGQILCYLNADDVLLPGSLRRAEEIFSENEDTHVIYGDGLLIDAVGKPLRRLFSTDWGLKRYAYGGCSIIQQSTFFRRSAFEAAGGFNSSNKTCWDGELLVDMAIHGSRFKRVNELFGCFRLYEQSISGSGRLIPQYRQDQARIFRKITGSAKPVYFPLLSLYSRLKRVVSRPEVILSRKLRPSDLPKSMG